MVALLLVFRGGFHFVPLTGIEANRWQGRAFVSQLLRAVA